MTDGGKRPGDGDKAAEIDRVEGWIEGLAASDGVQRQRAREHLVGVGRPAVAALTAALQSPKAKVRWEAAKALGAIGDPGAAPALVDALEDEHSAIRWLAATGLIAMGRSCLAAVLHGVQRCTENVWMQEGTRHVLHHLIRDGAAPEAVPVLEALEDIEPVIEAPVAAYHALQKLRAG